jgi:nitrogen regulatory protein P-II 1
MFLATSPWRHVADTFPSINRSFIDLKPIGYRSADTRKTQGILNHEGIGTGGDHVKKIEAIIKPFKLDEVKQRVYAAGGKGMTVSEVKGFGRTGGKKEVYRGSSYVVDFVPKVRVQCFVDDDLVQPVLDAIIAAARTGEIGDGKIVVSNLEEVIRIRTGERGKDAL